MPCDVVSTHFADVPVGLNTSPVVKDSNIVLHAIGAGYTCTRDTGSTKSAAARAAATLADMKKLLFCDLMSARVAATRAAALFLTVLEPLASRPGLLCLSWKAARRVFMVQLD